MRELHNRLMVSVPVEQAFAWFTNMDKNYIDWHPILHIKWMWLTKGPIGENTFFSIEEKTKKGNKHKLTMRISEYIENKRLCFSSTKIQTGSKYFPSLLISLLVRFFRIKMEMEREFLSNSSGLTTIITKHKLGSKIPIIGKLIDYGIDKFLFNKKDHLDHLEEEGKYMKRKLEENSTVTYKQQIET